MRIGSRWFINRASEIIIEELNHSYSLLFLRLRKSYTQTQIQLKPQVSFYFLSSIQISFWWLVDWLTGFLHLFSILIIPSIESTTAKACKLYERKFTLLWNIYNSNKLISESDIFIHIFSQNTYSFIYIYSPLKTKFHS